MGQDDVDTILLQAGLEGGYLSEDPHAAGKDRRTNALLKKRTEEEAEAVAAVLFHRAFLERDDGIVVIWNAAGVMPLETGMGIRVTGTDFITLGVLHQRHLVIGYTES